MRSPWLSSGALLQILLIFVIGASLSFRGDPRHTRQPRMARSLNEKNPCRARVLSVGLAGFEPATS